MQLSGWGRFPRLDAQLVAPRDEAALAAQIAMGPVIARGMGRAYGDSALAPVTVSTRHFNRMIAFDPASGQLIAESGVTLGEIIESFLPRGWFPSVTPGTRFVSLGGAIAADVHGKNHHREGSFGAFVDWIDLIGADGTIMRCTRDENADLFHWTLGGMGLTGVIVRAAIRLKRVQTGWIRQTTIPARDLSEALDAFEDSLDATYSMAWIDCAARGDAMGRAIVMNGEHATREELPATHRATPFAAPRHGTRRVPLDLPGFALNPLSVRLFNEVYYRLGRRRPRTGLVAWGPFFYPLDSVLDWNRIYGRKGFMQFQCVVPLESHAEGLRAILAAITRAGTGSFLAVLKRFGAQQSRLSFPMEGYTLALDFAMNPRNLALMDELDRITLDHGGRFYLAKDSRMAAQTLHRSDPRWVEFATLRRARGLAGHFASAQSERLEV